MLSPSLDAFSYHYIVHVGDQSRNTRLIQHLSVWRPLHGPILDSPLGLCDYRSVTSADRLAADHVSALSSVEVFQLKYNPQHRWYYLSNQMPDEICLFVAFDSHPPNGVINCMLLVFYEITPTNS